MDHDDLNRLSKRAADWARDYHQTLRDRPIRQTVAPGSYANRLPATPPEGAEAPDAIFADFLDLVPDGMVHWQHPRFFGYFASMAAPASMLAEQLVAEMSSMAMLWQTSPVATEMETVMVDWLRQAFGLSDAFTGTIHDSATTASLVAIMTMRDQATDWAVLGDGLAGTPRLRIYASGETHSSIDKCVRLSGIGQANLVKVPVRDDLGMDPDALDRAIRADFAAGYRPAGVVVCFGGTSVGAMDPVAECIAVAKAHGLPVHVDAAWAGNFMVAPEFRALWDGIDGADSVVINPYKGLGIQFDGAIQFLRDPAQQIRSMALKPEYLKTLGREGAVTDYEEWTIPLGRRFRALKIWFTLRACGLEALRAMKRDHVAWAAELAEVLRAMPGVEIATEPRLALFTFALGSDAATEAALARINDAGRVYLTQTRTGGRFVIRVPVGNFFTTREDVMAVADEVRAAMA